MPDPTFVVARDAAELAHLASELLAQLVHAAVSARGVARVALSGGSTPIPAYEALARLELDWLGVELYLVDERAGDPDSERSNGAAIARAFAPALAKGATLARMPASGDLEAGARAYEALLRERFGAANEIAFDALAMGIGDDGHTASLFPGTGAVHVRDRLVIATRPGDPKLEPRLTLTASVLEAARAVVVIAKGASKREPIARALLPGDLDETPARVMARAAGEVTWVVDADANPA